MSSLRAQIVNPSGTLPDESIVPPHPDGGMWVWEMVTGSQRTYADSLDALVESLYPGYADMDSDAQWTARYLIAVLAQVHVQTEINTRGDLGRLPRDQQIVLTGSRHRTVLVPTWDCTIPLVLIRTDYAPATGVPTPFPADGMPANIWWIDPSDDLSLLTSLHDIGYLSLHTSTLP